MKPIVEFVWLEEAYSHYGESYIVGQVYQR